MTHRKSLFSTNSLILEGPRPKILSQTQNRSSARQLINLNGKPLDNAKQRYESLKISLPAEPQSPSTKVSAREAFKQILESQNRTDEEALLIYDRMKDFKFFGQFLKEKSDDKNFDVFLYICKKLTYEAHSPGTVIMNQGDYSNGKVYIVLSGELLVYVQGIAPPPPPAQAHPVSPTPKMVSPRLESIVIEQNPNQEGQPFINTGKILPKAEAVNKAKDTRKDNKSITCAPTFDAGKSLLGSPEASGIKSNRESFMSVEEAPEKQAPKIRALSYLSKEKSFSRKVSQLSPASSELRKPIIFEKNSIGSATSDMEHPNIHIEKETPKNLKKSAFSTEIVETTPQNCSYGVLVNRIHEGSYFGEKALYKKHKRNATIVAHDHVELLTLRQEDFMQVQGEFNKARAIMKQFLRDIFPNVESVQTQIVLEGLLYNCEVKTFPYKRIITEEGESGDEFFVIFEGQCEFSKTVIYDTSKKLDFPMSERKPLYGLTRTKKEPIPISNAVRGTFIGEEILFNEKAVYEYTVKAASERVRLISLKKSKFTFRCPKPIMAGLQNLYNTKRERNSLHFQEKLQRRSGPSLSSNFNFQRSEGAKSIIALSKDQNATIQDQNLLTVTNFVSSPRKLLNNLRYSPTELNETDPPDLIEVQSGCPRIRSYQMYDLKSKESFIKNHSGLNDHSTININIFPDGSPQERKNTDHTYSIRPNTEPGGMSLLSSPISSAQKPFSKGFIPAFIKDTPRSSIGNFSSEKDSIVQGSEFQDHSQHRESYYKESLTSKMDNPEDFIEQERLFEESAKEKKNREVRNRRAVSAYGSHLKNVPISDRTSNRAAVPNFIQFLKMKQDNITKKKQKQERRFTRNSMEIYCKTSEPGSIISFGTPQTSPSNSKVFLNQNRKLAERLTTEFEKNLLNMKYRQKKPPKKIELDYLLKVDGVAKQMRPHSSRASSTVDMNAQFWSGLK